MGLPPSILRMASSASLVSSNSINAAGKPRSHSPLVAPSIQGQSRCTLQTLPHQERYAYQSLGAF